MRDPSIFTAPILSGGPDESGVRPAAAADVAYHMHRADVSGRPDRAGECGGAAEDRTAYRDLPDASVSGLGGANRNRSAIQVARDGQRSQSAIDKAGKRAARGLGANPLFAHGEDGQLRQPRRSGHVVPRGNAAQIAVHRHGPKIDAGAVDIAHVGQPIAAARLFDPDCDVKMCRGFAQRGQVDRLELLMKGRAVVHRARSK